MTYYEKIQKHFAESVESNVILFRSSVSGRELWSLYMKGFGEDPVYRDPASSVHNCNNCRNFIERYGNIVSVDPDTYEIQCIWDVEDLLSPEELQEYGESLRLMTKALKEAPIGGIFAETHDFLMSVPYEKIKRGQEVYRLGVEKNLKQYTQEEAKKFGVVEAGRVYEYCHYSLQILSGFIDKSGASEASLAAIARDAKESFGKLMGISVDTFELVNDLIEQDSVMNAKTYQDNLKEVMKFRKAYDQVDPANRDKWLWIESHANHCVRLWGNAMGELLKDIEKGTPLEDACRAWNKIVDPANFMKAKSPITKRQIEEAKKFISENGYEDSFNRRMATLVDIKSEDIKYLGSTGRSIKAISILDSLTPTAPGTGANVDKSKLKEIGIEEFMTSVLPGSKDLQILFEKSQEKNLMTLTTAADPDQKKIFKWPNNYSWTYNGGLSGKSMIKEVVKAAGGQVDAPFRCSLIWNESGDAMRTDLDIHCEELDQKDHVYYGNHHVRKNLSLVEKSLSKGGGVLDLDITDPSSQCNGGVAAENIFYPRLSRVLDGRYKFYAVNFNGGGNQGARAEIYLDGKLWTYEIKTPVTSHREFLLATLYIKDHKLQKIEQGPYYTGEGSAGKTTIWGIDTQEFHKVSMVCLSPNYWSEPGVGNKHYFFFMEGAECPDKIRSFHNENLCPELLSHRKVMEVLGNTVFAESIHGQLSGLGFNATVRDEAVVKVDGKLMKIKF